MEQIRDLPPGGATSLPPRAIIDQSKSSSCVRRTFFCGLSKFSTWLFRIAYNCYLDYRKKATIETVSVDSKQVLDMPSGDDPDRSFRYQHLYQALEQLSEKEKAVIVLYYFEDLSIKEIASILQMPVGTVKYHLSNGRNHLRNFLQ